MSDTQAEIDAKIIALVTMQRSGQSPRVAELLLIEWPAPNGPIYYASVIAADILSSEVLLDQLLGPIELRLPGRQFLEVLRDAGVADDSVPLDFWDGDDEMSRLFDTHGEGVRCELFYYFPEVDLLLSHWWGHTRPPTDADRERFKASAQSGFRSSMLPLPRRAFYTGCQAVFGGLLRTQAEVDEGDCPYSAHLAGTAGARVATNTSWLQSQTFAVGWEQPAFDDSGWSAAVDQGALGGWPWLPPPVFPAGTGAHWIWHVDSRSTQGYGDPGPVYFRKSFVAAGAEELLTITAYNLFIAFLVGVQVAEGFDWRQSTTAFLSLVPGQTYVLAVAVTNTGGPGGLIADVASGVQGLALGNMDPATSLPYTSCPRNNTAACIARLEPGGATAAPSYLAFDTIIDSYVVNETKGPNITVTARGNETNLKRPLRVIAGQRHVQDLDLMAFTVEPDTKHPDQGSVRALFAISEGVLASITNCKVNGNTIGPQHLNVRTGELRQPRTSFSTVVNNYSGTALFYAVSQGDFTKSTANDIKGECDVLGALIPVYFADGTRQRQYSQDRAMWLLECLTNKRWGLGYDFNRFVIEDIIALSQWFAETVSVLDNDGTRFAGPRSVFNAELIDRSAQQQITDICLSGRVGLPFNDRGKIRVVPLRRATELFSSTVFTDRGFWGALQRAPTDGELTAWKTALEAARAISSAALKTEAQSRLNSLFNSGAYTALARTDEEFVGDLYQAFFNHPGDPAGLAFWLAQVASAGRPAVLTAFGNSDEFIARCQDQAVPTFTDEGSDRNICVDSSQKSTLVRSAQSDTDLPNRIVLTFDDEAHGNAQRPLTFEDVDQQLRAGRAFGDTSRRAVEKTYTAFGVTDVGEAARLGNLLLHLGEFDEGGTENNLRVTFTAWYLDSITIKKYSIIKVKSTKLDRYGFDYFRVRTIKRMPDLKVEISAQAYPVVYYEQLELITTPPPLPPSGIDRNPGGIGRLPPWKIPFISISPFDDHIQFVLGFS